MIRFLFGLPLSINRNARLEARLIKTNASKIRRWNRLKYGSSLIYPGQKLKIWVKEG